MWGFANSLVVVLLYPGSLLMPAIYGFIITLFQTIFGTIVGDYVDTNPRMRGNYIQLITSPHNRYMTINTTLFKAFFWPYLLNNNSPISDMGQFVGAEWACPHQYCTLCSYVL